MEMPQYTESIEIGSAASRIWEMIARPERWSGGVPRDAPALPDYPKPDSRNNHIYLTRIKEDVAARAIRSQPPTLLEEARKERTFSRRLLPPGAGRRARRPHRRG